MTRMPRDPDTLPPTMPTEDVRPSKAEYREATEMGADAQHQGPDGGGIVRAVIAGLVVFFVVACVLLALRGGK